MTTSLRRPTGASQLAAWCEKMEHLHPDEVMGRQIMSEDLGTRVGTILNGIASGLIPMALFTPIYAIWSIFAWPVFGTVFFALAVAWSIYLAVSAGRLLRQSRSLPRETNADDARITKGMAIVSSIQGGLILTSGVTLALLGLWTWILPVVVLVVALHFFPMPWIFRRTIDFYLGTAMLIVAAVGLYLSTQGTVSWQTVWGVSGLGAAIVTSTYGLWMRLTASHVLRDFKALPVPISSEEEHSSPRAMPVESDI